MNKCFISYVPLRTLLFAEIVGIHIIIALDHAVVELALLGGPGTEIVLKLRLGGDHVLLPVVCKLQMPSESAVKPLIDAWRKSPLGESERGAAIARRIAKTAKRAGRNILSQFAQSRFVPMHTEMVFGKNGISAIVWA